MTLADAGRNGEIIASNSLRAPVQMFLLRISLIFSCIFLVQSLASRAAVAADQCWSPEELRHKKDGSERIRKDASVRPIAAPRRASLPTPKGFRPLGGVVRRVTLPPDAPKLVALTFDLCEQPYEIAGYQGGLVDFLRDQSIKATFFAGGKWMLSHQDRAQQLMADPLFEVANHTWEHRNLRLLEGARLDDEIRRPQAAYELLRGELIDRQCLARDDMPVQKATASRMGLFRFPFGACNQRALDAVAKNGLIAVQWDVSSGDPDRALTPAAMVDSVMRRVRPGSIILFHANGRGWRTPEAIPAIVEKLRREGYRFATVGELLRYRGAKWDVAETCYDAKPGDTDRYDRLAHSLEIQYERFLARFRPQKPRTPKGTSDPSPGRDARPIEKRN
jgi:peptidoglycan-N-acetylglucosamine deacetylase